jgi:MoxR-like ATPase
MTDSNADHLTDLEAVKGARLARQSIAEQVSRRIVGQAEVIDQMLVALFARGHCLFVGVPGLAKTLLVQHRGRGAGR